MTGHTRAGVTSWRFAARLSKVFRIYHIFGAGCTRDARAKITPVVWPYTTTERPHIALLAPPSSSTIPMTAHEHPMGTAKDARARRRPSHPNGRCLRVGRVGLGGVWFQLEICQQSTQPVESAGQLLLEERSIEGAVTVMEDAAHDGACVRACVRACVHAGSRACGEGHARRGTGRGGTGRRGAHPISTSSWNSLWIRSSKRWIPTW